jgi:hypothetical protein
MDMPSKGCNILEICEEGGGNGNTHHMSLLLRVDDFAPRLRIPKAFVINHSLLQNNSFQEEKLIYCFIEELFS